MLETQTNQLLLLEPNSKKSSAILHQEEISPSKDLYLLAHISNTSKKSELEEFKKITETIIKIFVSNAKMPADSQFESSLGIINQNLADMAHAGKKSWVGKFSALLLLKNSSTIYLADTGGVSAYLFRGKQITKLVSPKKPSTHPLKTFPSFTAGQIKENDCLTALSSNIFDYVAENLFQQLVIQSPSVAANEVGSILKQSAQGDESYASFFLTFAHRSTDSPATITEPSQTQVQSYSPVPEEDLTIDASTKKFKFPNFLGIKKIQTFKFGKINTQSFKFLNPFKLVFKLIKWFWGLKLSGPRKFLLACVIIFVLLLGLNIIKYSYRAIKNAKQDRITQQIQKTSDVLNEVDSALIYNNDAQAASLLNDAKTELDKLTKLSRKDAENYQTLYSALYDKVNRINYIESPKIVSTLNFAPEFISRAGEGFLLSSFDPNSISDFSNNSQKSFLPLNSMEGQVLGLVHAQTNGDLVISSKHLYRLNRTQKMFELIKDFGSVDLIGLKFIAPNRIYSLDKNSSNILRITMSNGLVQSSTDLLKSAIDFSNIQDFGVDSDVYLLFSDKIIKVVNGSPQKFDVSISDPLTSAKKIFVASNLYVLEPAKHRLLVIAKNGKLLNQVVFPENTELKDIYVDENQRYIYLLDSDKILQIIF